MGELTILEATRIYSPFNLIAAFAPQALTAADLCPAAERNLTWDLHVNGSGTIVGVGAVTAVGTTTYDGKGNRVNAVTVSANGRSPGELSPAPSP